MSALTEALAKTQGEHRQALDWLVANTGRVTSWATIKAQVDNGFRLVNQAKGIYKPRYTEYALTVRQTLDGPYADKNIERRPDGSWVYPYFQENPDPSQRDREVTNRGLMKCMSNGVPVGVLMQTKLKPGVEYLVLGLAFVTAWRAGYFILEGFSDKGESNFQHVGSDAAQDRAKASTVAATDFEVDRTEDARERQIAEVIRRKGQAKFRAALISAYRGRCVVTGCDALDALEAAHIVPYKGQHTNHPQNGLLLRADLHSLFDLGLLAIDPETMTVVLSQQLLDSDYRNLARTAIAKPSDDSAVPSPEALHKHLNWSGLSRVREESYSIAPEGLTLATTRDASQAAAIR
jgi:hypothetical protein